MPPLCSAKNGSPTTPSATYRNAARPPRRRPSAPADDQHAEVLQRDRHRVAGDREGDLGGQVDQERAGDHQHHVAQPGRDALADAHRDEEVRDREALLRGGHSRHGRQRVGHRPPSWRDPAGGTASAPSLPTPAKRRWVADRSYSPRTADTIDRRPAIRAGCAAASIASDTPRTRARAIVPTAPGAPSRARRRRPRAARRSPRPAIEPDDPADHAEDPGLDEHAAPDLATAHAGGPQDAELADSLPGVHRERVDDAEAGDDDGGERQQVEQAEHAVERVAAAPRRRARPGRRSARAGWRGRRRRPMAAAAWPGRTGSRRRPRRARRAVEGIRPADQRRLAGPARETSGRRSRPPLSSTGPVAVATTIDVAHPDAHALGPRRGRITAPPASIAAEGGVPVARCKREPAVGREVGAADRDRVQARAREREVERGDRASRAPRRRSPRSRARSRRPRPATARSPSGSRRRARRRPARRSRRRGRWSPRHRARPPWPARSRGRRW